MLKMKPVAKQKEIIDFAKMLDEGAYLVDVRTPSEFERAHIDGAKNWPLNEIFLHADKLSKEICVVLVCASGIRSGKAKGVLLSAGFEKVYNAGSWMSLERELEA